MTYNEFEQMLLRYGSDPDRWPQARFSAAEALLSGDPAAQNLIERMERLDVSLVEAVKVEPEGATLIGRVLTRVAARNKESGSPDWMFGSRVLTALGGAAALSVLGLGIFVGSLDLAWLDGTTGTDFSLLLLGETQEILDTL